MENFVKLLYEWEIELLVLLSLTIQMFLFFTGSIRRHNINTFLGLSIWIAYMGADLVAVFALSYLSRHGDVTTGGGTSTDLLALFWAPFLLIHLGGQDTITAFAIEDNKLWLRQLLNMLVQVTLSLYVFWKSIGTRSTQLLGSGIFIFVAGIIKYGERTWALKCGNLASLSKEKDSNMMRLISNLRNNDDLASRDYQMIVCNAICMMPAVRQIFAERMMVDDTSYDAESFDCILKRTEIHLGIMYDDLYTKALVLRTRGGTILRCISQVSLVVAFVVFSVSCSKQRYNRAEVAITYVLFAGGFLVDISAVFILMMSPWTWAWLEARKCRRLARMSWFLLSCKFGWPEKRPMWSSSMGQYSFLRYAGCGQSRLSKLAMMVVSKMGNMVGAGGEGKPVLWISKLLDTSQVKVDKEIMECVFKGVICLSEECISPLNVLVQGIGRPYRQWPNLGRCLKQLQPVFVSDFGMGIVLLHMLTEVHFSEVSSCRGAMDAETAALVNVCRKLSNYMMYLYLTHPEFLPLNVVSTLEDHVPETVVARGGSKNSSMNAVLGKAKDLMIAHPYRLEPPACNKGTLEEIRDLWARLLVYTAGQCQPEMHAGQLAKGGELLTFAWFFLVLLVPASQRLFRRIELTNPSAAPGNFGDAHTYIFYVPPGRLQRAFEEVAPPEFLRTRRQKDRSHFGHSI